MVSLERSAHSGPPGGEPLTIAIPFYRGIDFLKSAVESVLAQDSNHWRLVICDDRGSNEPVRELIASYNDPRIQYHLNESNLGMVQNWNKCLSMSGSHVTLLHGDDLLETNYVSTIHSAMRDHPKAAVWCCRTRIIGSQGESLFSFPDFWKRVIGPSTKALYYVLEGEEALAKILGGNFVFCPTLCYNREVLGGALFDSRWRQVQDLDLIYRVFLTGHSIVLSNTIAYAYRRHGENATSLHNASLLRFEEESKIYDETIEKCENLGWKKAAQVARSKRIIKLSLLFFAMSDCLKGRFSLFGQKIEYLRKLSSGRVTV
jgi:glycosyltransferase involved in cell wall biosynthesis